MSEVSPERESQNLQEEVLRNRFKNRRQMAWISFWMLVVIMIVFILTALFKPEAAKVLISMVGLLTTLLTFFTGIVIAYFTTSVIEHIKTGK